MARTAPRALRNPPLPLSELRRTPLHRLSTPAARLCAALVCALLAAGCGREVRSWAEVQRRATGLELRVEASDPALVAAAERATRDFGFGGRLIAGGFDDAETRPWLDRLGVLRTADGLRLADVDFGGPDDLLIACFEDPEHPGAPVTVYIGGPVPVRAWLAEARPLSRRPSLRLVVDRETVLTARLSRSGTPDAEDREMVGERRAALRTGFRRYALADDLLAHASMHRLRVALGPGVAPRKANEFLQACAATLTRAHEWCGEGETPMHLDLVGHADEFALLGGRDELGVVDPTGRLVAALIAHGLPHDAGAALARGVARQSWGPPLDAHTELAFGFAAAREAWGRPLEEWPAGTGQAPLESAVRLARQLVRLADSGAHAEIRALWTGAAPPALDAVPAPSGAAEKRARRFSTLEELRGIVLELPPVALVSAASIDADCRLAAGFGANGLSVSCSFIARDVAPERIGERDTSLGRTRQGDALLAVLIARARAVGLQQITLRPQFLDADSGEESARRKRTTADEWASFFEEYAAAIEHAALLAELLDVDILCLGEGLGDATRTEAGDRTGLAAEVLEIKRGGWHRLADRARARFGGDVAYMADWPTESGRLAIWDEFDLLTFSWFPALRGGGPNDVDERDLKRLLYGQLSLMDRFAEERGKPYLVLATGLPATRFAWRDATLASGDADQQEQARLYGGLAEAIDGASERLARFHGIALTGWGVDAAAKDRGDRAVDGPAEADLKRILAGGRDAD